MDTKVQHLLPPAKITPAEWHALEAILEGVEGEKTISTRWETEKRSVLFGDGFAEIERWNPNAKGKFYSDTGWEYPDPKVETVNIRDLEVDQEAVRGYLASIERPEEYFHPVPGYPVKDFVQDGIIEIETVFINAALNR